MPRGGYWRLRLCPGNFPFFVAPGMRPNTSHYLTHSTVKQALLSELHPPPAHCLSNFSFPPSPSGGSGCVNGPSSPQLWLYAAVNIFVLTFLCPSLWSPLDFLSLSFCPFSSLTPEHPSDPSEYARVVVYTVLEPVLQGLRGLPPEAQAPALSQALTATLGAWLDHILTHGIRFRWEEGKMVVAEGECQ